MTDAALAVVPNASGLYAIDVVAIAVI